MHFLLHHITTVVCFYKTLHECKVTKEKIKNKKMMIKIRYFAENAITG